MAVPYFIEDQMHRLVRQVPPIVKSWLHQKSDHRIVIAFNKEIWFTVNMPVIYTIRSTNRTIPLSFAKY